MLRSTRSCLLTTSAIAGFAVQGLAVPAHAQNAFGIHIDTPELEVITVVSGETVYGTSISVYADNGPVDLTVEENGEIRSDGFDPGSATTRSEGGVVIAQPSSTVTNSGLISSSASGVTTTYFFGEDANGNPLPPQALTSNTTVINTGSGLIIGQGGNGVSILGGGSVTNDGLIRGTGTTSSTGVLMAGYPERIEDGVTGIGSITNGADGTIEGGVFGVLLSGGGTIDNAGTIRSLNQQAAPGTSPFGVILSATAGQEGREATLNNSGSISGLLGTLVQGTLVETTINNSGSIEGIGAGMFLNAADGLTTINNDAGGLISGGSYAIRANAGDVVINNAADAQILSGTNAIEVFTPGAVINNAGLIEGAQYGVHAVLVTGPGFVAGTEVNNSGSIIGLNNDGIRLAGGGSVTNSGTIAGMQGPQSDGISMFPQVQQANDDYFAEVINLEGASVYGARFGIILSAGGDVTNAGDIQGVEGGVFIQGIALNSADEEERSGLTGGLINTGSITGELGAAVGFGSDLLTALLINEGTITSLTAAGVSHLSRADLTVTNTENGVIEGATSGIYSGASGTLTVENAGTIIGNGVYDGFDAAPDAGITIATIDSSVTNTGTIIGAGAGITTAYQYDAVADAVVGLAVDTVVVNSGTISGQANDGVRLIGGGLVTNSGSISGAGNQYADGVSMFRYEDQAADGYSAEVFNDATGEIEGQRFGVILSGGGAITNEGTISGDFGGVAIQSQGGDAGQVAVLVNTGTIEGGTYSGAQFFGSVNDVEVTNSGTIEGAEVGLAAYSNGDFTLVNSGTIRGQAIGVDAPNLGAASITNSGTIVGVTDVALTTASQTTLINSGTLQGGGDYAVILGAADDTVILQTGSNIVGAVDAGDGTDSLTLEGDVLVLTEDQSLGATENFESLNVTKGYWNTQGFAGSFGSVTVGDGASLQVNEAALGGEVFSSIDTAQVVNDGTLLLNFTQDDIVDGELAISGTGDVVLLGDAVLTVASDTLTYTGGTTVANGGLILTGSLSGDVSTSGDGFFQLGTGGTEGTFSGSIVNNGRFVFNRSDDYDFEGNFSGSGILDKYGAGTLIFLGDYSFEGVTNIFGGSVRIGGVIDPETEFDLADGGNLDIAGNDQTIGGLSGSDDSSVSLGSQTLTIDQDENTEFAGVIEGTGDLVLAGGGTLNLSGNSTYTGATLVNGGTLAVNGSIVSNVTVNSGGTLGGNGSTGGATINTGGTLAPGNSIGRLTVNGDLAFAAGSVYEVEVNAAGHADRVDATGNVTIASTASVEVMAEDGTYAPRTDYVIITGAGGVSGTFGTVTTDLAFLDPLLRYSENQVTLSLYRNDIDFADAAIGANQIGVATAVQALGFDNPLFEAVLVQNTATARQTFTDLSGEILASTVAGLTDDSRHLRNALQAMETPSQAGPFAWASGFGGKSDFDTGLGLEGDHLGAVGGLGYAGSGFAISLSGGIGSSDFEIDGRSDEAMADSTFVVAHAAFGNRAGFNGGAGVAYAWHDIDTSRSVGVPAPAQTLASQRDANTVQAFGEVGYGFVFGDALVTAMAELAHVSTDADGVAEAGGSAALTAADMEMDTTYLSLGAKIGLADEGATFRPFASAAWNRAFGDRTAVQSARFTSGGPAFSIAGVTIPRDSAELEAGFEFDLGGAVLGAAYSGVLGGSRDAHGARVSVLVSF
ncbi:autotransporter domain-containing protein [Aurantiacibacter hainanensis]|uniref:autotransporter domain-containing protein n=1 Tax=Aurantiacibacter hainanensis TaxID=3076114 RepID=UPI0030C76783